MADKSFGIKELNLIGASGTPTITSPNNLNLNASNVAISTDVTVGRHLDVDGHAEFDNVNIAGVTTFSSAINVSSSYGTSGQVLTSQGSGSAPQWATPSTSGSATATLSTTSTSTTLDGIPNSANKIIIGFNNIRVTTNDFLAVQLRSGGSNVTSSFYNYASKLNTSSSGTGSATIYFVVIENGWASNTDRLCGTFTLVRSGTGLWVASWTAVTRENANGFWGGGDLGINTPNLNGIRLLSGANFVGGTFSINWS